MTAIRRIPIINKAFPLTTTFTILDCAHCGVLFAVTDDFDERRRYDAATFYCPNGHSNVYGGNTRQALEQEVDRLKRRAESLSTEVDWQRTARAAAEKSASAYKGQVTKLRRRTSNGVCSECHRTFANVARHMRSKHPDQIVVAGGNGQA